MNTLANSEDPDEMLHNASLANSEDPDEMLHNAAFHRGLHCLLRQTQSSEKEMQFYLEIITFILLIYMMDHPKFIVSNQNVQGQFGGGGIL